MKLQPILLLILILTVLGGCATAGKNADALSKKLFTAVLDGDIDQVTALIKLGADINGKNNQGGTPVYTAVSAKNREMVKFLIKSGADLEIANWYGETPLFLAVENGYEDIARVLIENGADVNAATADGRTPLHETVQHYLSDLAEILLRHGADPNARSKSDKATPLDQTLSLCFWGSYDPQKDFLAVPRVLLKYGADPDAKNGDGESVLARAERMVESRAAGMHPLNERQINDLKKLIAFLKPRVKYKTLFLKLKPDDYDLVDQERKMAALKFITDPHNVLHFTFPESYISFIETIGLGYFRNDHFDIFMFDQKMFLWFNSGEDSHPELDDYIVFGYDDRNCYYFFDKDNKLKKGRNAIFRIRMDLLEDDCAMFIAHDFAELFTLLADNQELNNTWLKNEK
jgi:ankyrin repeat protein